MNGVFFKWSFLLEIRHFNFQAVPLFVFKMSDNHEDYFIPHWMNYSYYHFRKDALLSNFKTRVTFPMSLLANKEPALCIQDNINCDPDDYEKHDQFALRNFTFGQKFVRFFEI